MNIKEMVALKEAAKQEIIKKEREAEEQEKKAKHDEDTKKFLDKFFIKDTIIEEVIADWIFRQETFRYSCPSSWISSYMGSEMAHIPKEVHNHIYEIEKKFGIRIRTRVLESTRYCGSMPQSTIEGLVFWVVLPED